MRPLLIDTSHHALLRYSIALILPDRDEFASRSYARFMTFAPDVDSALDHRRLRRANDLMLAAIHQSGQSNSISQLAADRDTSPRHLAILATAILTSAGDMLKADWTVEIEAAWDEVLHNLVVQVIRERAMIQR